MGYPSSGFIPEDMCAMTSKSLHQITFGSESMHISQPSICTLPEEILEAILSYIVVSPLVHNARPTWHNPPETTSATSVGSKYPQCNIRTRLAVLLVSKTFLRISLPLFYHTVHIRHPLQARALFIGALQSKPEIASHIRRLVLTGAWAECGDVLKACAMAGNGLKVLDFTLNFSASSHSGNGTSIRDAEKDAQIFSEGLRRLRSVHQLTVRKADNLYLTQKGVRGVIEGLAHALERWDTIEYVDCAFRMSDDTPGSLPSLSALMPSIVLPPPPSQNNQASRFSATSSTSDASPDQARSALPHSGRLPPRPLGKPTTPNAHLIHSLRTRPRLRTFCTRLPNTWNECILRVSANPNLERIVLVDPMNQQNFQAKDFYAAPVGACYPDSMSGGQGFNQGQGHGQVLMGPGPTGLFMMQARKHPRLCELIRAGTFIMRTRAQTIATATPPSTPPPTTGTKSFAENQGPTPNTTSLPSSHKPSVSSPVRRSHSENVDTIGALPEHAHPFGSSSPVSSPRPAPLLVQAATHTTVGPVPPRRSNNRYSYHHYPRQPSSPTSQAWQLYSSFSSQSPVPPASPRTAS